MEFWFASDYHFGHANIIKYCNRPFEDVDHMDKLIVKNHNSRVKPNDVIIFLGDFCFRNTLGGKEGDGKLERAEHYLQQLNGRFVFIQGNHDNNNSLKTIIKNMVIEIGGKIFFVTHNPADFNSKYPINLVGHVHEKWKFKQCEEDKRVTFINLSCDVWNFMPVNINEILGEYERWKKISQIQR